MSVTHRLTLGIVSLVISLLIHCVFFEICHLRIPVINESFKPGMVFLGPILGSHEFAGYKNTPTQMTPETKITISTKSPDRQGPSQKTFDDLPNKTIFIDNIPINSKENLKSTFPEHIPERFQIKTDKADTHVNEPNYKPLSIENL